MIINQLIHQATDHEPHFTRLALFEMSISMLWVDFELRLKYLIRCYFSTTIVYCCLASLM